MHGHNGRVEVHIEADKLDARGMVQDFSDIKEAVKNWIDETLDHRMLLRHDDPLLPLLKQHGELFYVMDENPTAENIAKAFSITLRAERARLLRCSFGA